jgi:hypothetical protein
VAAVLLVLLVLAKEDASDLDSEGNPALSPEQSRVHALIEQAAATRNADDCARLAGAMYLEQREHLHDEDALQACQTDVFDQDEGLLDEPVSVSAVSLMPERGYALATITHESGSDWAGLTVKIRVVSGKLSQIGDFVEPDRAALEHAVRVELSEGPPGLPKPVVTCAVQAMRSEPDGALVSALKSSSATGLYRSAVACDPRMAVEPVLVRMLRKWPFLRPETDCAARRAVALPEDRLVRVVVRRDERPVLSAALACDRDAAIAAYAAQLRSGPPKLAPSVSRCVTQRLNALPTSQLADVLASEGIADLVSECR